MKHVDYCDTPDELDQRPEAKKWITAVANGNPMAFEFVWRFWCFSQCFDDLIDRDKPVSPEVAMRELVLFVETISSNPFYLEHKGALLGLMIQAATRAMDGDEWGKSEDRMKRLASHVVRCGDIDLFMHVAYLTGGWDYMRSVRELRSYDIGDVEQAELRLVEIKKGAW